MAAGVESDAGTSGYPMLQVGGEQEAVMDPEPGNGVLSVQDCRHPAAPAPTTLGWDALHVKGTLLRTIPLFVFGREVLPIISVRTAVAVCELVVEEDVTKVVCPVC